jgi:isocitrate lyase
MGKDYAIARSLAYAPYADLLWWETSDPDLDDARLFAEPIQREFPGKMLAYNCSPSFNWQRKMGIEAATRLPARAGRHGLQVPVRHAGRLPQPEPLDVPARQGLQRARHGRLFRAAAGRVRRRGQGFTAVRHQREVGVGYFDAIATAAAGGHSSTTALKDSTEAAQFAHH